MNWRQQLQWVSDFQEVKPGEFALMLDRIMRRAGLSVKDVVTKSGISRSSVYRMIAPNSVSLPPKRIHVAAFARACGLSDEQVEAIGDIYRIIDAKQRRATFLLSHMLYMNDMKINDSHRSLYEMYIANVIESEIATDKPKMRDCPPKLI